MTCIGSDIILLIGPYFGFTKLPLRPNSSGKGIWGLCGRCPWIKSWWGGTKYVLSLIARLSYKTKLWIAEPLTHCDRYQHYRINLVNWTSWDCTNLVSAVEKSLFYGLSGFVSLCSMSVVKSTCRFYSIPLCYFYIIPFPFLSSLRYGSWCCTIK